MGFSGESLHSFNRAEHLGFDTLELVSPTSHVSNLQRQHAESIERHGIGGSWLNEVLRRKINREYEAADAIYVHSNYTRDSFLQAGVPATKLKRTYLQVHPRFHPPDRRTDDAPFRIVYVGRVDVTKGIPLLLEAFEQWSVDGRRGRCGNTWSGGSRVI
jgi:glycosyltransferase involved in cell wall biosynthesis